LNLSHFNPLSKAIHAIKVESARSPKKPPHKAESEETSAKLFLAFNAQNFLKRERISSRVQQSFNLKNP
jgi:hypothetical protein